MIRLILVALLALSMAPAAAHDLPGEVQVTGYFDRTGPEPRLALRVPLVMLTNVNLPKRGPGYLDFDRIEADLPRAEAAVARAFQLVASGSPLEPVRIESRISQPSERTFESMETAEAAILGSPLPPDRNVFWNQGFFDVLLTYPQIGTPDLSVRTELPPGLAERTTVTLGISAPGTPMRALAIDGAIREIALDPTWLQAGSFFLTKGVEHILIGTDHLLFLLCLILPLYADPRRLLGVVTAFTAGHSVTLIPAALGFAPTAEWFLPMVETLIGASIVYMAAENVLGAGVRLRWRIAFGFGLIHGFGFASTLTDVTQFAGAHLVTSLVFFNIGIELGQVLVLAVAVPMLTIVFRARSLERSGIIVISLLAGHEAWHWVTERASAIRLEFASGPAIYETLTWTAIALVIVAVIGWASTAALSKFRDRRIGMPD